MSVPRATSVSPAATTAADPELDPPGTLPGATGLAGVPSNALIPLTPKANSWSFTLPTTTAPARLNMVTTEASIVSAGAS